MKPDSTLFEVLKRHGVPFVVVGGFAVVFHGHIRQTEDIDVVWVRNPQTEVALSHALAEIGAEYIGKEIDPATRIERTYPVTLGYIQTRPLMMLCTRSGFLDLFSYVPGFPEADVDAFYQESVESAGIRYTSIEWLRKMKKAAGRLKDLEDLEKLPPE